MLTRIIKSVAVYSFASLFSLGAQAKEPVEAVYIPLADHYATIVAFEKYASQMTEADFKISMMKSWPSLKGKFMARQADMAMIISPMAMNIYKEDPSVKWISLIHRNGNAMAVNDLMGAGLDLSGHRSSRKPTADIAAAIKTARSSMDSPPIVAVPSLESTHTLVMYKFMRDHGLKLAIGSGDGDAIAKAVAPPKSPDFIAAQNARNTPAAFEQSLPWADIVETTGKGRVAWYSKDVLPSDKGHVECIIIAHSASISGKEAAMKEVIHYIHKAGQDIEAARDAGPEALKEIAAMVRKHIPLHSEEAILASLDRSLDVISYRNLNVDQDGLIDIMDLAVEAGVLDSPIDVPDFADDRFSTDVTDQ